MKKLEISQMENLQGGVNQRNCMLMGVAIGASAVIGCIVPAAFAFTGAAFLTAANSKCF